MKAPSLPEEYNREFLQGILDDLYQRFGQLDSGKKVVTVTGQPSGKEYKLSVDDTTITSPAVVAKR